MQIDYKIGDLFQHLDEQSKKSSIIHIPHVVNIYGIWGAGFVVPLGKRYPDAKRNYLTLCEDMKKTPTYLLGNSEAIKVEEKVVIHNMFAQTMGGTRPLYYNHLVNCMEHVSDIIYDYIDQYPTIENEIWCPRFGSGLAGGCKEFINELIIDIWIKKKIKVVMFDL